MTTPRIAKGRDGWQAKFEQDLGFNTEDGRATLQFLLCKPSRGTGFGLYVNVAFRDGSFMRYKPFSDFRVAENVGDAKRVTEKALAQAWAEHVAPRMSDFEQQAMAFYNKAAAE